MSHTLLLADDSITIQRVIELTFADENVQVVSVSDGEQAIARLDAAPPDIVLADIGMPGKNGYEVAEYVKQTPRLAHIPVVLLAGAFEPVDQAKASAAGCDGVLAKPFEPQQVIGRVKELLARGGAAAPTKVEPVTPPASKPATEKLAPAEIDSYFDRLDAAFAGLTKDAPSPELPHASTAPSAAFDRSSNVKPFGPPSDKPAPVPHGGAPSRAASAPPAPALVPPATPVAPVTPATSMTPVVPVTPTARVTPVSAVTSVPPVTAGPTAPEPTATRPERTMSAATQAVPSVAAAAAGASVLPPIADAFAALLAAEQNEPPPAAPPNWPSTAAAPAAVGDDVIEQVTRRVLDQLSDRIVRETVADIVARVAERLVRDEIERIKTTIK